MPHDPSDPAASEETTDRLTRALREVAGHGRRSAPTTGAFVRRRAVLRRRARRAGLVSAGLVLASTAVVTGTALLDRADRSATPPAGTTSTTTPAPHPSPDATPVHDIRIDLTHLELHAAGRTFPISAPSADKAFRAGDSVARVTELNRRLKFVAQPGGEVEEHDWVLRFQGSRKLPHFIYATVGSVKVPGRRALGPIGLRTADARWLYEHTVVGAKVTITGTGTGG
ncbi:hypothetical protein LK07_16215 [Streptomyces pluripotens]|uniref:L,D-transpeptidase n=1 Tax=Streptomyces pluripotens TaxID=1355015 RepID=A0A221NZJ4_9ACTN|nr:hypothetical protein [Streptomyces pluripotens]ARP71063.1 hypothetical protein LK06_015080 [Streptomyces pluripotens]ASN25312.1 hypothetical protein LK07_16215 [Streptomyces pluripotens]